MHLIAIANRPGHEYNVKNFHAFYTLGCIRLALRALLR
jgi:hypothetical protein